MTATNSAATDAAEPFADPQLKTNHEAPFLELRGIRKAYGGLIALSNATMQISRPGSVHALAGENGSGKSTLLGILSGQLMPDEGQILINGEQVTFKSPADAISHGIAMVSQETSIALDLTVGENVLLGRMERRWWGLDRPASMRTAARYLERLGCGIDPMTPARALRPDQLQLVEIARALSMDARILILDEPTSSLAAGEAEALVEVVDDLRQHGVVTVFVSHRMSEVLAVADEMTVLRDGTVAYSGTAADQTHDSLVSAMLGPAKSRRARELASHRVARPGEVALSVQKLTALDSFNEVSVDVRHGEIVGLAGLEGSGRNDLLESLFGELPVDAGEVYLRGEQFRPRSPRHAIDAGVAFLPPDRKTRGLVLSMSIRGNASMVGTLGKSRVSRPDTKFEDALVDRLVKKTTLRMANPEVPVGALSGGNQQKVALGKWLVDGKDILLLDEPTRGVDIGAKLEIHDLLRKAADDGAAILVSSSENEELLGLCDRIVVMARRQVAGELSASEASLDRITKLSREGHHGPGE